MSYRRLHLQVCEGKLAKAPVLSALGLDCFDAEIPMYK